MNINTVNSDAYELMQAIQVLQTRKAIIMYLIPESKHIPEIQNSPEKPTTPITSYNRAKHSTHPSLDGRGNSLDVIV